MTSSTWSELARKVFTYKNLVHAVSGATGSTVALSVFYPLDTARTRLQVDDNLTARFSPLIIAKILEEEGLGAVYRGWFPVVTSLCCSNFVYFYVYNGLKAVFLPGKPAAAKDLLLAFCAGVVNVLTTTPLWVVNTRLKLQGVHLPSQPDDPQKKEIRYLGIIDCLRKILQHEGVSALWSGTVPSLVLVMNPAIHFMVYEMLKRYMSGQQQVKELSGLTYFMMGAIAKMAATIITYPMQVIQARLRAGYYKNWKGYRGLLAQYREIISQRGFQGLYKGLEAKLMQTVLMAALMFLTYEKIASFVFHLMGIPQFQTQASR